MNPDRAVCILVVTFRSKYEMLSEFWIPINGLDAFHDVSMIEWVSNAVNDHFCFLEMRAFMWNLAIYDLVELCSTAIRKPKFLFDLD